jgi:predicted membrane protein
MENKKVKLVFDTKLIIGLAIICVGLLFLFQNMGYLTEIDVWDFWPVIPILIGLSLLTRPSEFRQPLGGLILIAIGLLFLLRNLDIIPYDFSDLWPFFLILIGFYVIKSALSRTSGKPPASSDYINLSFVLGGGDFRFNTQNFKGGKVDCVMGGGTIDLRDADFKGEEAFFDSFVLMGGVEIRVPEHWQVNIQGSPHLGGMENKTTYAETGKPPKKFTIKSTTIMGGLEIRN